MAAVRLLTRKEDMNHLGFIVKCCCASCGNIFHQYTFESHMRCELCRGNAVVGELADPLDLESSAAMRPGSSPGDGTLVEVKRIVQGWVDQQGHDRCWYYPDLFRRLAAVLDITMTVQPKLPPRPEFEKGCKRYQKEEYEQDSLLPAVPVAEEDERGHADAGELAPGAVCGDGESPQAP